MCVNNWADLEFFWGNYLDYLWLSSSLFDGWRDLALHRWRLESSLAHLCVGRLVCSWMFANQLPRGRPFGLLPSSLPSVIVVSILFFLLMWQKYFIFLDWISRSSCLFVPNLSSRPTFSLFSLCLQPNFTNLTHLIRTRDLTQISLSTSDFFFRKCQYYGNAYS